MALGPVHDRGPSMVAVQFVMASSILQEAFVGAVVVAVQSVMSVVYVA